MQEPLVGHDILRAMFAGRSETGIGGTADRDIASPAPFDCAKP